MTEELLQTLKGQLKKGRGALRVVQWLRLRAPSAGGPGSIPGWRTGFHVLQLGAHMPHLKIPPAATATKQRKNNKEIRSNLSNLTMWVNGTSSLKDKSCQHKDK